VVVVVELAVHEAVLDQALAAVERAARRMKSAPVEKLPMPEPLRRELRELHEARAVGDLAEVQPRDQEDVALVAASTRALSCSITGRGWKLIRSKRNESMCIAQPR